MLHLEPRILKFFPHFRKKDFNLLDFPAPRRHCAQREAFEIFKELDQIERPNLLLLRLSAPGRKWRKCKKRSKCYTHHAFSLGHIPTGRAIRFS